MRKTNMFCSECNELLTELSEPVGVCVCLKCSPDRVQVWENVIPKEAADEH